MAAFNLRCQIVVTWGTMRACCHKGGEQLAGMDLANLAFDHPSLAGELLKKVMGEENLADGQEVRADYVIFAFFALRLCNSINTIVNASETCQKYGTQNKNSACRARHDQILLCELSSSFGRSGADQKRRGDGMAGGRSQHFRAPPGEGSKARVKREKTLNLTRMSQRDN